MGEISNLKYERDNLCDKTKFYEQKSEEASHELLRVREDCNRMKERFQKVQRDKENIEANSQKKVTYLQ